jgi:hypothetical protein
LDHNLPSRAPFCNGPNAQFVTASSITSYYPTQIRPARDAQAAQRSAVPGLYRMARQRLGLLLAVLLASTGAVMATLDFGDLPDTGGSAIAVDATTTRKAVGTNTISFSHTTGTGANRLMLVGISKEDDLGAATFEVSGITYGGQALTRRVQNTSSEAEGEIWSLVNPPSGTATLLVSFTGAEAIDSAVVGVTTFTGVNQTTPFSATNSATGTTSPATLTISSPSGEWVFGTLALDDSRDATSSAGQTQLWSDFPEIASTDGIRGAGCVKTGAGSTTVSWTIAADNWVLCAVSLKPAGTGPGDYLTLLANDGPRHYIVSGKPRLGVNEDIESNGQPNATATGDDAVGSPDDEDGVAIPALYSGETAALAITVSGLAGKLDAWIDWNANGSFDAGEQIATNRTVALGANTLNVAVPVGATSSVSLGARFRISSAGSLAPTGLANDGEVEDYMVMVTGSCIEGPVAVGNDTVTPRGVRYDYPAVGQSTWYYAVTSGSSPAISHVTFSLLCPALRILGAGTWNGVSQDALTPGGGSPAPGTWPAAPATDPTTGITGLKFGRGFAANETLYYYFTVNGNYVTEGIVFATKAGTGFDTAAVCGPSGDCALRPNPLDFGDLADTGAGTGAGNYQTSLVDNGPRHSIVGGATRLGINEDGETDGQPNATATGDDANGTPDDEDGVTIPALYAGQSAALVINVTGAAGKLDAWIDWNRNGAFNVGEQIATNRAVALGNNTLNVSVPADAANNVSLAARFRISSAGGLAPTGLASNGEVEDYMVMVIRCDVIASAVKTDIPCNGAGNGTITASATGGTAPYQFKLDSGTYQSSGAFTGVAVGAHTVTAKDANGCLATVSVTISQPAVLVAAAVKTDITCNGAGNGTITASATGGTAPYQFKLDSGSYQTSGAFTGVAGGAHTVTAKDANGCLATVSVTINQPAVLVAAAVKTDITCNGAANGTITASATGGTSPYQFKLDSGSYQTSGAFTGVAAGAHTVTAKDANGCLATVSVTINQPAVLVAAAVKTDITCNGAANGTITASATGGTSPYQFKLDSGSYQSSGAFTGVAAGAHTVTAKDANGCLATVSVTINQSTLSLGNRVFLDSGAGGGSPNNGIQDGRVRRPPCGDPLP